MTDPRRWLEGGETNPLFLEMLSAAKEFAPNERSRTRILSALVVTDAAQTETVGGGAAAPVTSRGILASGAAKWVCGAVLVVLGGAMVAMVVSQSTHERRAAAGASTPPQVSVTVAPPPSASPLVAAPPPIPVEALPSAASTSRPPSHAPARTASLVETPGEGDLSIAPEMALLERANDAYRAERSEDALRLLEEHRNRFPSGMLRVEAEVLRIEVLAANHPSRAREAGLRFLAEHPRGVHARRIRTVLERME